MLSAQGPFFGAALALFWGSGLRIHAYIDGFNLYYGALKGTPHKWLDLKALAVQLLPAHHTIERIKYFTARVSGAEDPDPPRRQHIYLRALQTISEMEVHFGLFCRRRFGDRS